jgi:hypothetical protein
MLVHGGISMCDVAQQEDAQQQQQQQQDMCISVGTPGMSGVGLTVDHDAAMWCNQARPPARYFLTQYFGQLVVCSWCYVCGRCFFIHCTLRRVGRFFIFGIIIIAMTIFSAVYCRFRCFFNWRRRLRHDEERGRAAAAPAPAISAVSTAGRAARRAETASCCGVSSALHSRASHSHPSRSNSRYVLCHCGAGNLRLVACDL